MTAFEQNLVNTTAGTVEGRRPALKRGRAAASTSTIFFEGVRANNRTKLARAITC